MYSNAIARAASRVQGEGTAVETGEHAEAVELRLEDPPRVVERPVHQGGRHRAVFGRGQRRPVA
jgi:hypothetical protein